MWKFSPFDINDKIPLNGRSHIYHMYYLWVYTVVCLVCNWIAIVSLISQHFSIGKIFWPSIYLFFGVPGSWYLWYRRIFCAFQSLSQTKFAFFTFGFFLHILFVILMTIGFQKLYGAGILIMLKLFVQHTAGLAILLLITSLLWFFNVIASLWLYKKSTQTNYQIQYRAAVDKVTS